MRNQLRAQIRPKQMFDKVANLRGCRTLEMYWGGIGDWRA